MKNVLPWLAGWLALFWLWQLISGEWDSTEWVAGAAAATIAMVVGRTAIRVPWRAVAASGNALPQVFVDFAIVMWALVRRRSGRVHTRGTDVHGSRAWINYAANFSPNAFVIDIDDERVTLHDLVPNRKSESPA